MVANLGMLVRPSTKAGLETQGAPRPANLFSHADQQLALQSGDYTGFNRIALVTAPTLTGNNGGILPYVLRQLAAATVSA